MPFDYRVVKKNGIEHGHDSLCTVMAFDVVEFTRLGSGEALNHAVHSLEYVLVTVLKNIKWDERKTNNGAVLNPSGDGYFIGFNPSVPDRDILGHAVGISKRLKDAGLGVRIGINKGTCTVYRDLNAKLNLSGWGIIDAQRVMSLGGRDHILCTEGFAKDFQNRFGDPNLISIGKRVVKRRELEVYNYFLEGAFGNSTPPGA